MENLLLVHGAMHGAWCWELLVHELDRHGIHAVALDLPGNGTDQTQPADATLERYAKHLVAAAEALPGRPVIVGHSAGGLAVSAAIELAPSAFSKAVYVAALLPVDGDTLAGIFARSEGGELVTPMVYSEDGTSFWMTGEHAADYFYNGCAVSDIAWAIPKLTPQPIRPLMAPIKLTQERFGLLEKVYVRCSEDRAVPLALQDIMIGLCPGIRVHTLPCGHSPFMALPRQLADLLATELGNGQTG